MGIKRFWEERSAGGKDAFVALSGGGAAILFARIVGTEDVISFAFGLTVIVALGAVSILSWIRSLLS